MRLTLYFLLVFFVQTVFAFSHQTTTIIAPQPTSCISGTFNVQGDQHWKNITLTLKNACTVPVDFQNSSITFLNKNNLNTSFWGNFNPLPWPDNNLQITSQRQTDGQYLSTLSLHFPNYGSTKLPVGSSIAIQYGVATDGHVDGSVKAYTNTTPVDSGSLKLQNATAKPSNVSQTYALVHVTLNGQKISDVQLPWNSSQTLTGLAPGSYNISADNVTDSSGLMYQATAVPSTVSVTTGQTANATISYSAVQQTGKLAIQLQALPAELSGYTGKPVAQVTQTVSGSSTAVNLNWGATTTVTQLKNGVIYNFSTAKISYNSYDCTPSFTPTSLTSSESTPPPTTSLTYSCTKVSQSQITTSVSGAPTTLTSLKVSFTPNNSTPVVTQTVPLSSGSGSGTVTLTTNVIYTVSSDPVSGYSINFNPQPLTATPNAKETITLTANGGSTPVAINGQLKVCGTQLCNQSGIPIQIKGMSTHGLQWYGWNVCITPGSLDALANSFQADVIRISMYVQEDGYETDPAGFTKQVNQIIDEVSKRGMYAIVDFHQLDPGDPNYNLDRAKKFFTDIATANKGRNNLLYDICNEPNGVSWATIKSYADKLIPVIRAIDPNSVILIGTHGWSSLGISDGRTSQDIINNPVTFPNIMYTFHFYAASHKDEYLNELDKASNVLPIFVTEFGTQTYSGDGANDFVMSQKYIDLLKRKKIGWTNWNYSDDFRSGAVWKEGTCSSGNWTDAQLKPAGVWIKDKIKTD